MLKGLANRLISAQEYLQGELRFSVKHEYVNGHVYAMSGGSMAHQRIARNFPRHAGDQLAETESLALPLYRRVGKSFERDVISGLDQTLELSDVEVSIPLSNFFEDVQCDQEKP